ncbi:hypothetical protein ACLOJK_027384 [Asimina triloba]
MKMVKEERKNDRMYKVWMSAGSGDYSYEGGYTSVLIRWETSIEPKFSEEDPDFDWDTEEVY